VIESHPAGYRLAVPPEAVDVMAFETLAARGSVRSRLGSDEFQAAHEHGRALSQDDASPSLPARSRIP